MSTEAKFIDGLRAYAPRDNAPSFVKANLVVNVAELQAWLAQRSGEVRVDIKESRGGKFYASENDYKPSSEPRQPSRAPVPDCPQPDQGGFTDDNIPFAPLGKHAHWIA